MPGQSGQLAAGPGGHVVQFYVDDTELAASVSTYLGEGLRAGDSAVVVATLPHRLVLEAELAAAGLDVTAAMAAGRLLMLDAAQTLGDFRAGDQIDRERFDVAVGALLSRAAAAGQPVRIYAEMVALLWDSGHVATAIELEALWNDLGSRLPFSLLCAYPARLMTGKADPGALDEVCRLHADVIGPYPGPAAGADRLRHEAGAERSFSQALESTRAARHFVLEALGCEEDDALAADAAIVTAELAANAVLHARSGFSVAVSTSGALVRISVRDAAPLQRANGPEPLPVTHGHGLWLVGQVSDAWAVEPLPDGKVVWAELSASRR